MLQRSELEKANNGAWTAETRKGRKDKPSPSCPALGLCYIYVSLKSS